MVSSTPPSEQVPEMPIFITIAWRNILRHKGKSFIVGTILFIGALLMTLGNGVISGMEHGMSDYIVHGFCGHVVIASDKQESDNVFLEMMGKSIEPISNYKDIKKVLTGLPYVDKVLPLGKNMVMILNEEGAPGYTYVIGADWKQYHDFFADNLRKVEGEWPTEGQPWVLFPTSQRKDTYDYNGNWYVPLGKKVTDSTLLPEAKQNRENIIVKDSVIFMGFNEANASTDISIPICGVTTYRAYDKIFGQFALMDIESYRAALGYISAGEKVVLDSAHSKIMASENLDDMFSTDNVVVANSSLVNESQLSSTVDTPRIAPKVNVDDGTYNLVCVMLKPGEDPATRAEEISAALKSAGCGAHAFPWNKAIGPIGSMAMLIKAALFGFVMFLFFVAIIIIVNTLSMAALERSSEIGMMRAVGARRWFIAAMFTGETACLSFIFGGAGIVAGIVLVAVLDSFHLKAPNEIVQLLYGGEIFRPMLSVVDLILALVQLALVTVIAVIYPVFVALGITPLDAISRD